MSEQSLKPGWKLWRFDQMAISVNDRIDNPAEADVDHYVGLEHLDSDSLKIRRWGSPSDVEATKLCFRKGDIIFGRRRVYQRKLGIADFDGICSAHALVLRARPDVVLPAFLPFFMQSDLFMNRALEISVGSLSPTINWKTLASQQFSLPSMEEQRKRIEHFQSLEQSLEAFRDAIRQSEQLVKSARRHLFKFGLDANRVSKEAHTEYGQMPATWQEVSLDVLVEFLDSSRVPLKSADRAKRQGIYPYYGASGIIDHVDEFLFDEELILLSEDGANLVDRNTPVAFIATGKFWVNNHAHVLRVLSPHSIHYITHYLESINYIPFLTGTAQPKLNKSACANLLVPVPPYDEEQTIASVLTQIAQTIAKLRERESRLMQFKTQLLRSYF